MTRYIVLRYNLSLERQTVKRAADISAAEYRRLAEFRHQIRLFLRFSERAAREAGVEPVQHQLLLAIRGNPRGPEPTIGELAERLQLRHHSVVELVDRLERRGLVARHRAESDARRVAVRLTRRGLDVLHELSRHHLAELRSRGPDLVRGLEALIAGGAPVQGGAGGSASRCPAES